MTNVVELLAQEAPGPVLWPKAYEGTPRAVKPGQPDLSAWLRERGLTASLLEVEAARDLRWPDRRVRRALRAQDQAAGLAPRKDNPKRDRVRGSR